MATNSMTPKRLLVAAPFIALGTLMLMAALWLFVARLLESFVWKDGDQFVLGGIIYLIIFGGALVQFGQDAITRGHVTSGRKLISPGIYYFIGLVVTVPATWSAIEGSPGALVALVAGICFAAYGCQLSNRAKSETLVVPCETT